MSEFSAFFSRPDPPLLVVTTTDGIEESGCLVGFATQCSIHPPRLLVCVSVVNHTVEVLARADVMAVHLLGSGQLQLASIFGEETGDRSDKFTQVAWHRGVTGAPILDECAAWLEGRVLERVPLGDHTGHVIEPVAGGDGGAIGVLQQSAAADFEAGHSSREVLHGAGPRAS